MFLITGARPGGVIPNDWYGIMKEKINEKQSNTSADQR